MTWVKEWTSWDHVCENATYLRGERFEQIASIVRWLLSLLEDHLGRSKLDLRLNRGPASKSWGWSTSLLIDNHIIIMFASLGYWVSDVFVL